MNRPTLSCKPSLKTTHLLLVHNQRELLRAVLPSALWAKARAAPMLCEALARWLGEPLYVALYADREGISSALALCDGEGVGDHCPHYEVEVLEPPPLRRPRPLGSLSDLRKLAGRGEK